MSEIEIIKVSLARDGKKAYNIAKRNDCAYVLSGNKIYKKSSNGQKELVSSLSKTKVLVRKKKYAI